MVGYREGAEQGVARAGEGRDGKHRRREQVQVNREQLSYFLHPILIQSLTLSLCLVGRARRLFDRSWAFACGQPHAGGSHHCKGGGTCCLWDQGEGHLKHPSTKLSTDL